MIGFHMIQAITELSTICLFLQKGFGAKPGKWSRRIFFTALFGLVIVVRELLEYTVVQERMLYFFGLLLMTCIYHADLTQRMLSAVLTVCCNICRQRIAFLIFHDTLYHMGERLMGDHPNDFAYFGFLIFLSLLQLAMACILSRVIQFYRAYPRNPYTSIFLIAFCLCMMALEMFVTLIGDSCMPVTSVMLFLVLVCIGLCGGLVRDQVQMQEERCKLEFLEKHNADQLAHYTAFYNYDRDVHKLRHDLRNFVIGAQSYLHQKKYEELDAYLNAFLGNLKPVTFIDTGNPLLDAVITAKRTDAPEIPLEVVIPPITLTRIDPMDVAMLLATALDNAIEGTRDYVTPYIRIHITEQGRILCIRIDNPTNHQIVEQGDRLVTQKQDADLHGYGMPGMQRIASKYHGRVSWRVENEVFSLRILLQEP